MVEYFKHMPFSDVLKLYRVSNELGDRLMIALIGMTRIADRLMIALIGMTRIADKRQTSVTSKFEFEMTAE